MFRKLSHKLIISFIILTIFLAFLLFSLLGNLLKSIHIEILKTEMSRYDELIDLEFKKLSVKPESSEMMSKMVSELADIMKLRITIIKTDGTVIADSEIKNFSTLDNHQYRKEIIDAVTSGSGFSTRYSSSLKTDMLYYAIYKDSFLIRLSKPLHEVDRSIAYLRNNIFKISLAVLFVSILMIIFISLKITKPFNETLDFADDFADGNYQRRILNYSNDEIGSLQKTLNKMADKIVETINDHIFEQKKLKATLDSISDGIAMIDSNKHISIFNNSFLTMLGITVPVEGKEYFEIIGNGALNSGIDKNLQTGEKDSFVIEMSNDRFFEAVINPIRLEKIIQGILIVLHDISEKKKIERIKADLISNVSHELKTPIAIIRGYLETIKENYNNRELTMNFIDSAIENVDRQNSLIRDIITLSMIESTREFEKQEIDIKIIIERCLDLLAPKILKKGLTLVNNLDSEINYSINGNMFLVEEIFFNIIDNGINYNSQNGTLRISSLESAKELTIKVSDTGIGIPVEFQDRIFERFFRIDRSRSRATGGTGLGLSIVKHASMVLGWKVSVTSSDKGSVFIISINK